ncbi:MAG: HIT family hydrolase, partial [bacterium]
AGIDDHIHYHIVPRWNGDTNFMPVFTDVKVISEHIATSYDKIMKGFKEVSK